MSSPQGDLKAAQAHLDDLKAELPNYHTLVGDNEEEALRLRETRAPLDEQAQAKARVNVARELLEQHLADIDSARARVEKLSAEVKRTQTLAEMVKDAKDAQKLRERYDAVMGQARAELEKHLKALHETRSGLDEARARFYANGEQLVPGAFSKQPFSQSMTRDRQRFLEETARPLLSEIEKRGVDLSYVTTAYNPVSQYWLDDPRSPHRYSHPDPLERLIAEALGRM